MPIPVYHKQLSELLRKNEAGIANTADSSYEADQSVIREMRVLGSTKNNNDSIDMPLEIEQENKRAREQESKLDPIDTEAEVKEEIENNLHP